MNEESRTKNAQQKLAAIALLLSALVTLGLFAQGGTGNISGVVTTKAAALKAIRVTMDQRVCGNELPDEAVVVDSNGHLANAVITVSGLKSTGNAASSGIMNEKCRFSPRVQIVRPNATITTSSKDPILHTTNASLDGGKSLFNVAVPVPGIKIVKPVSGAGLVRVVCNTHPWMRGYVIVTDELAAISGSDGAFSLPNVPTGTYELRIWHESLKAASQKVTVTPGQTATVSFELR
jgi:plastocyanin